MKNQIITTALIFTAVISNAQTIPNSGFENWSNAKGYYVPDAWGNLNDITSNASVFTCTKGTPGNPGTSYLKLTSKSVAGIGVVPGVAVSGALSSTTFKPVSGFAYSERPTALTGKWQYMGNSANDIGSITAYLTKWNSANKMRDTVGYVIQKLNGMVMSWANFSFPFTYKNQLVPDSCIIVLNASGAKPEANSYLYVDNLNFTLSTAGISNSPKNDFITVYPNPSCDLLTVDLSGLETRVFTFTIVDLQGRVVWNKKADSATVQSIPTGQLPDGTYIFEIETENGIIAKKFTKE
jgi:hypothetical protein